MPTSGDHLDIRFQGIGGMPGARSGELDAGSSASTGAAFVAPLERLKRYPIFRQAVELLTGNTGALFHDIKGPT